MVTWGIISGAMAFVQGPISFYVMRFLLGAAEAGFFPGIILYLGYWFPGRQRAGVVAFFMAAAPISTAPGSPISAGLLEMHGLLGLTGWQWLFIMEAIPALILGVVVFCYMTDRPEQASWLEDRHLREPFAHRRCRDTELARRCPEARRRRDDREEREVGGLNAAVIGILR